MDESLNDYHHIHPVADSLFDGVWHFSLTPKLAGKYSVYLDFIPLKSPRRVLLSSSFTAKGKRDSVQDRQENLKFSYEDINFELINTPFNFINLINKCINLIKQQNISLSEIEEFENFSYSFQLNTIYTSLNSLYLTDKENEIFKLLIENKNIPMSKKQLLSKVWNYSDSIDTHTLETHIYTLRKKIKKKLNLPDLISHNDTGYLIADKK